jgi:hypothetical protein
MKEGSWSWHPCSKEQAPAVSGEPRYLEDGRTFVLPVKLGPDKVYAIWLNTEKLQRFQDRDGQPAWPYLLIFQTGRAAGPAAESAPAPQK